MNRGRHEQLAYSNWSFQVLASHPPAIASRSMSLSSARISRPTCARRLASALAAVVDRPCLRCRALNLARPSGVFAPVDLPPCIRQRALPVTAGFLQGVPARVLAPQRCPRQPGPSCQSRPHSRSLSFIAHLRSLQQAAHRQRLAHRPSHATLREGPRSDGQRPRSSTSPHAATDSTPSRAELFPFLRSCELRWLPPRLLVGQGRGPGTSVLGCF
jgi:hypothetical protein